MSTQFFGDVPQPSMHHQSEVRDCFNDYEVFCPQCRGVIVREIDPNRAMRASTYHNTVFIDKPQASPAPPPWAGSAVSVGFSWGDWMSREISLKD